MNFSLTAFLPELVVLAGALVLFCISLGDSCSRLARTAAMITALGAIAASIFSVGQGATLFDGAYQIDLFSQLLKVVFAVGFGLILLLSG